MTTLEMLDAVEAGISTLRSRNTSGPLPCAPAPAAALRAALRAAGMAAGEFARTAGLPREDVEAWTAGIRPAPEWVLTVLRVASLLTPSARHKLLYGPGSAEAFRANHHPFSRIEEL